MRSSGENSQGSIEETANGFSELGRGCDIAIRRGWDGHRLPATAQDERASAALHHAPVNLRPEGHKIIDSRSQRHTHHEPDGEISNPVNGKEIVAVDRPLFPAMIEDDRDHGDDLYHHFELAKFACLDGEALGGGNLSQSSDQKLAADDH